MEVCGLSRITLKTILIYLWFLKNCCKEVLHTNVSKCTVNVKIRLTLSKTLSSLNISKNAYECPTFSEGTVIGLSYTVAQRKPPFKARFVNHITGKKSTWRRLRWATAALSYQSAHVLFSVPCVTMFIHLGHLCSILKMSAQINPH